MRRTLAAALFFAWSLQTGSAQLRRTAFTNATIIDGTGAPAYRGTLVIEGERIAAVGPGVQAPAGSRIIDAAGLTIMPGIFDLHTHITASGAPTTGVTADWPKNLMAYLYCGVTSIADLGEYQENFDAVRALLAAGSIQGPRVAFASRFSTPGGHGAEGGRPEAHTHEASTPEEAHAAMADVLRGPKPDLIKIFTDGWRYGTAKDMTSMDAATLTALVEDAHRAGLPVITHTVTVEKARIAAAAGVDIIGHGLGDAPMDDELLKLMRARGTRYVSTLAVYEPKAARPVTPLLHEVLDPALGDRPRRQNGDPLPSRRWSILNGNVAAARNAGLELGAGTDAGMPATEHGWTSLRELKLLTAAGLTPLEAITAATGTSAKALRVDRDRGILAAGKLADLIVLGGRPDQDIDQIENIRSVYLGGHEVNREMLRERMTSTSLAPLPAVSPAPKIDDFEGVGLRAANGQLWVDYSDPGHDRSRALLTRGLRGKDDHTLLAIAKMGEKENPRVEILLPFAAGGMLPADLTAYKGVRFEARGEGAYRLVLRTRAVRDMRWFAAPFELNGDWGAHEIRFSDLKRPGDPHWTGDDVLSISFEIRRRAGQKAWIELDNLALIESR